MKRGAGARDFYGGYKKTRTNGNRKKYSKGSAYQFNPRPMVIVESRRGELKGMDTDLSINQGNVVATTNTNDACIALNLIRAGTGSWNRIGRKVKCKSVRIKGKANFIYRVESTTLDIKGNFLRMVVIWDKQPSGAALPSFDTVFGRTEQDGTESSDILDAVKYDNMGRFQILGEKVIDANIKHLPASGGTTDEVISEHTFDHYIKIGRDTIFEGNSSPMTIADISTGGLYIYFRASRNDNNISQWSISGMTTSRLRYTDY